MDAVKLSKLAKCAGCGAKVGAGTLAALLSDIRTHKDENLLVGFDHSDDASIYRISDDVAIAQTVDFFPPMVDDPYTFGQIAATNALSDIYAMGGTPKLAQNVLIIPKKMDANVVHEILRGGYDKVYEAGAILTGGHSIHGEEPVYGLAVTGFLHPQHVLKNDGAKPGDVLFLTKKLGVGIAMTALKAELLSDDVRDAAVRQMTTLNRAACEAMRPFRVHACTDVTGFSLMGHGLEMARGSGVTLVLHSCEVPLLDGVTELAAMGLNPEGMYRNRDFAQAHADLADTPTELADVLFDPQTSGGLLIAVDPADADELAAALAERIPDARRVGEVVTACEHDVVVR